MPAGLTHAFRRAAGRRGQHHATALGLENAQDGANDRGLAGARATCNHQHAGSQRPLDGAALRRGEHDALLLLEPGERLGDVDGGPRAPRFRQCPQARRGFAFDGVERRAIYCPILFPAVTKVFERQFATLGQTINRCIDERRILFGIEFEQFQGAPCEQRARQIAMTRFLRLFEDMERPRLDARGCGGRDSQAGGNAIGGMKPDAVDVARQTVRILAHHLNCPILVSLENLGGESGRDAVSLQEHHHILDAALFDPGVANRRPAHRADALDLAEALGRILDHVESFEAKMGHQARRHRPPDAPDQARAEVALDADQRRRLLGQKRLDRELSPVTRIVHPPPPQAQAFARLHAREQPHHRHEFVFSVDQQTPDRPARVLAAEDHALKHALDNLGRFVVLEQIARHGDPHDTASGPISKERNSIDRQDGRERLLQLRRDRCGGELGQGLLQGSLLVFRVIADERPGIAQGRVEELPPAVTVPGHRC